jgi:photosystem II stability/assembly factor-like uncharacterized protein
MKEVFAFVDSQCRIALQRQDARVQLIRIGAIKDVISEGHQMKRRSMYIFLALVLCVPSEVHSQWIKAYTPYNGYVSCLSYVNSKLYAGSKGSLYVSTNNGKNWISISLTEPNTEVRAVAGNGNNIFAGTFGKGIYLSTDNGNSWAASNSGLTNLYITSLAAKDSIVLVGTSGNGVFRSINYGQTWSIVDTRTMSDTINAIIIVDSIIIAGSNRGNTFRSNDNGIQWELSPTTSKYCITSFVRNNDAIFAGSNGGGVCVSQDGGRQWYTSNVGLFNHSVTALTIGESGVFAATTTSGVFRSTNKGGVWVPINNGLSDSTVTSLTMSDSSVFAGTIGGGVFRSSDNGKNWTPVNAGLVSINVNVFLTHGEHVFAGTQGAGVLLSTDRGKSWSELNSGLTALNIVSLAIHHSTIYAATDFYWVFKSSDYGKNWIPTTRVHTNSVALAISDSVLYVTAMVDGVYRTTDEGNTWHNMGLSYNFLRPIAAKDSLVMTGSEIYKGVFLSSNYGKDWDSLGSSKAYSKITVLGWCGNNIIAGMDNGIFLRASQGGSWVRKGPKDMVYSMAIKDSIIIAGTYSGVYLSTDWGERWAKIDSGLFGRIYALAIVGSELFAGDGNRNIWKTSLSEVITEVKGLPSGAISDFSLNQNYPNPFNSSTTLSYGLPTRSHVRLAVYNLLGQIVAELVNAEQQAGWNEVVWNATVSSGLYFYRLEAITLSDPSKRFVDVKKLLFLK